jgi:CRISPR/Cas system-associated endoribonuclease Cas2
MNSKMISNRLDAIINPVRNEMRLAQEQALKRIQQVIFKAETEVAHEARFMTLEQRLKKAEKELEKAEEQLLSALSSIIKALSYIAPQNNFFIRITPIKEIKGRVIDRVQNDSSGRKLGFLSWKK